MRSRISDTFRRDSALLEEQEDTDETSELRRASSSKHTSTIRAFALRASGFMIVVVVEED